MPTEYELGLLVGLLIGEGHFGGDGKQPQITLRMHVRHEALFRWLEATFPGGKLYGPYDHSGRRYYQWMARGSFLRDELIPLIESRVVSDLDGYAFIRFTEMQSRYAPQLAPGNGSGKALPEESRSDPPIPPEGTTGPTVSPAPTQLSDEIEPPDRADQSDRSALSRAESIFSRMRGEASPESGGA